jgi:hypothetical protein
MRDVLRLVGLIGYYVEIECAEGSWEGVVDAVTYGGDGARIRFADGSATFDVLDPDEWNLTVYRRAPHAE